MNKTFQPVISADFLKTMEDSPIGKALIEKAGISAFKMLSRFTLHLPAASNPTGWLVESDVSLAHQLPDITLFLKYAWFYSNSEDNEHIDRLRESVSEDITSFEKDLLIKREQRKLHEADKLLRSREEDAKAVEEELVRSQSLLKSQKSQIKQQKKDLKCVQKELEIRRQKEKISSIRHSNAASKPRGCLEVNEYLEELVRTNSEKFKKIKIIELWSLISKERDGSEFYKEDDKLCHEGCTCMPFGIEAFYRRIQKIKENLRENSNQPR